MARYLFLLLLLALAGPTQLQPASAAFFHGQSAGPIIALPPTLSSIVSVPSSGSITTGAVVNLTLNFTAPVIVASGTPTLTLNMAGASASYISGSGTTALLFRYTVGSGQNTADLAAAASNAILLNGATMRDVSGNNADLTPANGYAPAGVLIVDTTAPTIVSMAVTGAGITSGSGSVSTGAVVTISDTFSETVNVVGGTPSLALNDGGVATYISGSGTNVLAFSYTVVSGQNTPELTVTAFNLNGSTIRDVATNNANTAGGVGNPPGVLVVGAPCAALVFSDNFSGTTLTQLSNNWFFNQNGYSGDQYSTFYAQIDPINTVSGLNPYTTGVNGLKIIADSTHGNPNVNGLPWYTGLMRSKFTRLYGYFEVVSSMPLSPGSVNGANWIYTLVPSNNAEMDLVEHFANLVMQTIWDNSGTNPTHNTTVADITAFHTYAVDWNSNTSTMYLDGVQKLQVATPANSKTNPMAMILSINIGNDGTPATDGTVLPQYMTVKTVKVWTDKAGHDACP